MKFLKLFLFTALMAPATLMLARVDLSDPALVAAAVKEKIKSMPLAEKLKRLADEPEVQEAIEGAKEAVKGAVEKAKSSPEVQKLAKIASSMSVPEALEILKVKAEPDKPTVAEAFRVAVSPDEKIAILREAVGLIGEGVAPSGVSEKKKEGLQAIKTLAEDLKKSGTVTTRGLAYLNPMQHDKLKEVFRRINYVLS